MSGPASPLRRAAEAIGRAVVAAGAAAASAPVLGLPPGPPIVACYPDVVWVVVWLSRPHAKMLLSAWHTPETAEAEQLRLVADCGATWAMVQKCVVRP